MSDRINGFVVALEGDFHAEDAERIADAIRQIRGVSAVTPNVTTSADYIARSDERHQFMRALHDLAGRVVKGDYGDRR